MKLKEDLTPVARVLYFLIGLILCVAAITTILHDGSLVLAGKISPFGLVLLCLFVLPLAFLIVLWACVGRHREWGIHDDHIRIDVLSLTAWRRIQLIKAQDIELFALETYAYEDRGDHTAYWLSITCKDGKRYGSPKTYDKAQAERACERVERLQRQYGQEI